MRLKIFQFFAKIKKYYKNRSIQFIMTISFTLIAVACSLLVGTVLYSVFAKQMEKHVMETTNQLLEQTDINLENYLRNMMRISNSMYYSVIKNKDIEIDNLENEMNILYEANKDSLISIAVFAEQGDLVSAMPISIQKKNVDATSQNWFQAANEEVENLHFSVPHVQNLFENNSYRYYWVISLSHTIELTAGGTRQSGILLIDMNYDTIEQMLKRINNTSSVGYVYLMDNNGEIIYHPKQSLINSHLLVENNLSAATYLDGIHDETFEEENRLVVVKTVGYTGWKIVSVVPRSTLTMGLVQLRYVVILILIVAIVIMMFLNQFISYKISKPIKKLENSVRDLENGNFDLNIYIGGSYEIRQLGRTTRLVVNRLKDLMEDMVKEQEDKRTTELDALQSQINPHFLYNALDSIVWMIEGEKYEDAVDMITDLASLFRISLSRGKNLIPIKDEVMHALKYMNIQQVRFKNKFSVTYNIAEEINDYYIIKLVLQPILENAIYYGMEFMDGDGEIIVCGYEEEGNIFLTVEDNGLGMPQEVVDELLVENKQERVREKTMKRGSGVGLCNVNKRLKLRFGNEYGLVIISKPDEGTLVKIKIPIMHELQEEGGTCDGK